MSALIDRPSEMASATYEAPVEMSIGAGGIELSKVVYWQEDGDHVFRSIEYDVIAGDADPYQAIRFFVHNTIEYARLLSEAEHRTPEDVEIANAIMGRIAAIFEAMEREREAERETKPQLLRRLRHGRRRRGNLWHLSSAARS